jgi:hypothetical protein
MTAGDVLAECVRLGVQLGVSAEGKLRWRCRGPLPPLLRRRIATRKADLLALLGHRAAWDQGEADRLLAEVRAAAACVGRAAEAGRASPAQAAVAALCVKLAEQYSRGHDQEAGRGWDALELLRAAAAQARRFAQEAGLAPEPPTDAPGVHSDQARPVGAATLFEEGRGPPTVGGP